MRDRLSARNLLLVLIAIGAVVLLGWLASEKSSPVVLPPRPSAASAVSPEPIPEAANQDRAAIEASSDAAGVDSFPVLSVRGRVVDFSGKALGDLRVGVLEEDPDPRSSARTGADGSFEIKTSESPCQVAVLDPGWVTLVPAEIQEDTPGTGVLIVAAAAVTLPGSVFDRAGRPLPGARLELRLDASWAATLPATDGTRRSALWTAASGIEGRFLFEAAPGVPRVELCTSLQGWRTDVRSLELPATEDLRIVLDPEESPGPELEGTVVHADGSPAPGAFVSLGSARTRTDARGAFRFFCRWFEPRTPLIAVERGFQPAVLDGYGARIPPHSRSLPPERLVLPGPALAIEGRVLSQRGQPCKGWRVAIEEGTRLDPGGFSRETAETQTGGRIEVKTDSSGAFRLDGLAAKTYSIFASGRDRAARIELSVRSKAVEAGARGLVLIAPDASPGDPIRGRVLTLAGAPIPGVRVGLGRPLPQDAPGEYGRQRRFESTSAADGSFEILGAPACQVDLVVAGEGILPVRIELDTGSSRRSVDVRVRLRRGLRFDGTRASPRPDALRALAADGSPTPIFGAGSPIAMPFPIARLSDGASGPIAVGDDAREIVLYRGCEELGRVAIPAPAAGEVPVLFWP
jgi:protocatechuate 3,4-dioxygenase beta subunit